MVIIPAIDIKNGKCVRLTQGDFNREIIYEENPLLMAKQFEKRGAKMLHIVDLDGAKGGKLMNADLIGKIAKTVNIPLQVGGGIRNEKTVEKLLSLGIKRVILGTMALSDKEAVKSLLYKFASEIAVSLDTKNGKLMQSGWQEETEKEYIAVARELQALGVKRFIYTDTIKDGTLTTPNFTEINQLQRKITTPLLVGGGIATLEDIKKLKSLQVEGVIIGKALYEKKFSLKEALDVS